MIKSKDVIVSNIKIAENIYRMRLKPSKMSKMSAGQFVNIKVDGFSLRRPFGLCNIEKDCFDIIYRVQGEGTKKMSQLQRNDVVDVIKPLGSAFPIHEEQDEILIIGGGIGTPPLLELAKQYRQCNKIVKVVLGFATEKDCICEDDFKQLGCDVYMATMDGSYAYKGNVLDAVKAHHIDTQFVYSCGSLALLRSVSEHYEHGYISAEARMACGIGACMGCVCKGKKDKEVYYRICKEGPVFKIGEVEL
ncbi:MAG: dihydroorotate dehydrogenase electron transfer subunit [Breznakia sp.]